MAKSSRIYVLKQFLVTSQWLFAHLQMYKQATVSFIDLLYTK
jgi:hypothetical protein